MSEYLLVRGVTDDGRRFRPSDWVERLACAGASFPGGRLRFSALLRPVVTAEGKALAVALRLQNERPELWRLVMDFAAANRLVGGGLMADHEAPDLAQAG